MSNIEGKVVIITGASSGIAKTTARSEALRLAANSCSRAPRSQVTPVDLVQAQIVDLQHGHRLGGHKIRIFSNKVFPDLT